MQMQARNNLPELVRCDLTRGTPASHLDVTATRSEDGKTLVLQVVNTGAAESAAIGWSGFAQKKPAAHVTELIGPANAANTAGRPDAVRPTESDWNYQLKAGRTTRLFPAQSFTIFRFE